MKFGLPISGIEVPVLLLVNCMVALMEGESSWDSYPVSEFGGDVVVFEPVSKGSIGGDGNVISLDNILPDDILERILSCLPLAGILRAASVCKRWCYIVHASKSLWADHVPQKPWYFMFTCNEAPAGLAYDPMFRKWYNLFLPSMEKSSWFIACSLGLVCFMDNDDRTRVFVCNPITGNWKRLLDPPGVKFPEYCTLAISGNRRSHSYTIALVKSKQVSVDFLQWELSIHIYESKCGSWVTLTSEVLMGWRGGNESIICGGVLYCLIHATAVIGNYGLRHGLIMYDILSRSSRTSLLRSLIQVPCSLTCARIMNLNDRLMMVGGIAKFEGSDVITRICIWELHKKEWIEIARMPHRFFQGFGEFDDVFASSGADDLIYIHSYGSPALLIFDTKHKQWKWSVKCPVNKRSPLQLFTGFCFMPRLEVFGFDQALGNNEM